LFNVVRIVTIMICCPVLVIDPVPRDHRIIFLEREKRSKDAVS
jgi:hypothetical protein